MGKRTNHAGKKGILKFLSLVVVAFCAATFVNAEERGGDLTNSKAVAETVRKFPDGCKVEKSIPYYPEAFYAKASEYTKKMTLLDIAVPEGKQGFATVVV